MCVFHPGDEARTLAFCDSVRKVGRSAVNERLLVLSATHLQLLSADVARRVSRSIAIADIEYVSISRRHAEVIVIHHIKVRRPLSECVDVYTLAENICMISERFQHC